MIDFDKIMSQGFIPYLKDSKEVLTKDELYLLFYNYVYAAYLRNGQAHVESVVEMVKQTKEDLEGTE